MEGIRLNLQLGVVKEEGSGERGPLQVVLGEHAAQQRPPC